MDGGKSGCLGDLHAAAAAVGNDGIRRIFPETLENRFADGHGDVVRGDLESVGAGLAAATGVGVLHLDPRNLPEQLQAGAANPLRPQMARSMVQVSS